MQYDVIVAGAGPSGSTAARECAARGLSVLMVDRAEFPRDKPCGGGVNMRAAHLLPFPLDPVIERVIYGMRVSVKLGGSYVRYAPAPLTYMTRRSYLDAFLVQQAVSAGAVLRERAAVREVERSADRIIVLAGRERFHGRTLVVADGANGRTATLCGIEPRRDRAIALEGNIMSRGDFPEKWRDVFGVDVGTCQGGYGWLFPKRDHVNIGVGGHWSIGATLRPRLDALTRFYGFDPADLTGVRGHPLPVRRIGSSAQDENVVLAGDAAGLVDVLSGEGIFSAVWSGRAAARHVTSYVSGETPDLSGYQRELESDIGVDLSVSRQLYDIFHMSPTLAAGLVRRSSRMWQIVCGLVEGTTTYESLKRRSRLHASAIDATAWFARTAARRAKGDDVCIA